jgi:hypothetical protein
MAAEEVGSYAHLFVGFSWKAIRDRFEVAADQEVVGLANTTFAIIGAAKDFAIRLHETTGVNVEHGVGQLRDEESDGNLFQAHLENVDAAQLVAICGFLGVDPANPFTVERTWLDRLLRRNRLPAMEMREKVELALCQGMDNHINAAIEQALTPRPAS